MPRPKLSDYVNAPAGTDEKSAWMARECERYGAVVGAVEPHGVHSFSCLFWPRSGVSVGVGTVCRPETTAPQKGSDTNHRFSSVDVGPLSAKAKVCTS